MDALARLAAFARRETVLVIAAAAALLSMLALPLTPATTGTYLSHIDMRTIGLLFCLMTVVAGLGRAGLFERVARALLERGGSPRRLSFMLVTLVFAFSMLVTNDVALITFVPLTLMLYLHAEPRILMVTVVAETLAANLGSMCTPIGNPQNIYLFSRYALDMGAFFSTVLPTAALGYLGCIAVLLLIPRTDNRAGKAHVPRRAEQAGDEVAETGAQAVGARLDAKRLVLHGALFAVCLACVARVVPWQTCTLVVLIACAFLDRAALKRVDYSLLATFACFFVFVGNLQSIAAVEEAVARMLVGHEVLASALASQVISNVPAAIMLSGFTGNGQALLLGVNIGGLGTPVASLASLISLRLYANVPRADTKRFLTLFAWTNCALLALLLTTAFLMGWR